MCMASMLHTVCCHRMLEWYQNILDSYTWCRIWITRYEKGPSSCVWTLQYDPKQCIWLHLALNVFVVNNHWLWISSRRRKLYWLRLVYCNTGYLWRRCEYWLPKRCSYRDAVTDGMPYECTCGIGWEQNVAGDTCVDVDECLLHVADNYDNNVPTTGRVSTEY